MKNRTIISVLLFLVFTISCNNSNSELKKIDAQLKKLQNENLILKDSLSKLKEVDWEYRMLVGIPNGKFKVGEKNKITFLLHSFKELPKYDVYKVEDEKDVKISSENFSKFDYEYLPKSNSDNKVSLKIRIPNSEVEILNETTIPLK